ncbi:MAG: CysS/YqeB C-terminal domain-containing protein, partial [Planctomycetota bacterium]
KKSGELPAEASDIDPGDPYAIADYYCEAFIADGRRLGLKVAFEAEQRPELMPRPTQYIPQMIELVKALIEKGHAYVADDDAVYFDVQSFPDYGRLSGNSLQRLREKAGGRVAAAHQVHKKHPADFLLWKPDPRHIMRWASPWGDGYPGWHLECSVMAQSLLGGGTGGVIDIHSGGEDNIFPHHECEIAQACSVTGEALFARCWFHTRHLIVEGEKMSKSKGNFFTINDVLDRGGSPAAIRLELTKTHYRQNSNFTWRGLKDSQVLVDRWNRLEQGLVDGSAAADGEAHLAAALVEFTAALSDDLNVSGAIGALNTAVGRYKIGAGDGSPDAAELEALRAMLHTLGVSDLQRTAVEGLVDVDVIEAMIKKRNVARDAKDWSTSDRIREELVGMGIALKDGPEGTTWSRTVRE